MREFGAGEKLGDYKVVECAYWRVGIRAASEFAIKMPIVPLLIVDNSRAMRLDSGLSAKEPL
jgi:hypothetical protein